MDTTSNANTQQSELNKFKLFYEYIDDSTPERRSKKQQRHAK